VRPFLLRGVI